VSASAHSPTATLSLTTGLFLFGQEAVAGGLKRRRGLGTCELPEGFDLAVVWLGHPSKAGGGAGAPGLLPARQILPHGLGRAPALQARLACHPVSSQGFRMCRQVGETQSPLMGTEPRVPLSVLPLRPCAAGRLGGLTGVFTNRFQGKVEGDILDLG